MENQNFEQAIPLKGVEQKNNLAIAGAVLGIFAFLCALIPCLGWMAMLTGALALTFGIIAYTQIKKVNGSQTFAIIALVTAGLALTIEIFGWIAFGSATVQIMEEISKGMPQ